jgi:hypothetical protein
MKTLKIAGLLVALAIGTGCEDKERRFEVLEHSAESHYSVVYDRQNRQFLRVTPSGTYLIAPPKTEQQARVEAEFDRVFGPTKAD